MSFLFLAFVEWAAVSPESSETAGQAAEGPQPEARFSLSPLTRLSSLQPAVPQEAEVRLSVRGVGCRAAWPFMVALPSLDLTVHILTSGPHPAGESHGRWCEEAQGCKAEASEDTGQGLTASHYQPALRMETFRVSPHSGASCGAKDLQLAPE